MTASIAKEMKIANTLALRSASANKVGHCFPISVILWEAFKKHNIESTLVNGYKLETWDLSDPRITGISTATVTKKNKEENTKLIRWAFHHCWIETKVARRTYDVETMARELIAKETGVPACLSIVPSVNSLQVPRDYDIPDNIHQEQKRNKNKYVLQLQLLKIFRKQPNDFWTLADKYILNNFPDFVSHHRRFKAFRDCALADNFK